MNSGLIAHGNGHGSCRGSAAIIPGHDDSVVSSGIEVQSGTKLASVGHVGEDARGGVDSHGADALRTGGAARRLEINGALKGSAGRARYGDASKGGWHRDREEAR